MSDLRHSLSVLVMVALNQRAEKLNFFRMKRFYMRESNFTDSQIMDAVNRVDAGFSVPYICRDLGISTATIYKRRAKYGGMDVLMMSRMKELEDESRRLKRCALRKNSSPRSWWSLSKKSGGAISQPGDVQTSSARVRCVHTGGVLGVWHERVVIPIRAHPRCRERRCAQLAAALDRQPPQLGLWTA
jgi:putative transposase